MAFLLGTERVLLSFVGFHMNYGCVQLKCSDVILIISYGPTFFYEFLILMSIKVTSGVSLDRLVYHKPKCPNHVINKKILVI